LTETNHGYIGYLVTVNPEFWDSLPADIRSEMDNIVHEFSLWANEQAAAINNDGKRKIIESGATEVVTLSPDELRHWQQVMRPVWGQFEGNVGVELIDAALAARE
jgi:C4-dicarboxylate-binding protein DctP